ncbi:MAG: hypothetical protein ACK417_07065 [Bacteroidia bacterium]
MKTTFITFITACLLHAGTALAQNVRPLVAVLNIDTRGLNYDPRQMGNLVRFEFDRLGIYEVMNQHDLDFLLERNQLDIEKCYGAICLTEIGTSIKTDKMLGGSVELAGEIIFVQLRLVDVQTGRTEKSIISQYLNNPREVPKMVSISMHEMFNLPVNADVKRKLTERFEFDNMLNNPDATRLALDGPRMGLIGYSGEPANRISAPRSAGGYNAIPVMFQFGYQFEKQYLNEGRWQALFEFIPMITGMDQQLFIPSVSILNGFRDNFNGWEIAFGPTINIVRVQTWYQADDGRYYQALSDVPSNMNYEAVERLDRRGLPSLNSSFVIAAGRSFKSGHMNIPVNVFYVPARNGARFGLSVGFNAKNKNRTM